MKHDVAILLALVAVLAAGGALVLAGADFRARREERKQFEELRARRPYFGWEPGHVSWTYDGCAYVGTAW